ncbi:MAG: hypothetical protein CMP68_05590 [Flavobacteriales bacterium]|nr:hypothetical protein [Flavobacteriales bacterium]
MRKLKLSHRIFMSMLVLIFFSFLAVGITTIFRYQTKNKEYHKERLKRKDRAVVKSIEYMFNPKKRSIKDQFLNSPLLNKLSDIHNLNLNIYDLNGSFISTSFTSNTDTSNLSKKVITNIARKINSGEKIIREIDDKKELLQIYRLLYLDNQPYGILNIPYDSTTLNDVNKEIRTEVLVLLKIYSFLFLIAGLVAVFLLNQITKPLKIVTQKLKNVEISKKNEPIFWAVNDELGMLIRQYNKLIEELKDKADKLAKSERQSAWKKMARQIAHEIKNPLTPMRLSVQHFAKTIATNDDLALKKLNEFTSTMLQQIDTMSAVASSFSNFASLTNEFLEKFQLEEEVDKIVELYKKDGVVLINKPKNCFVKIDKTHLTRILNNLIQNAIQSISNQDKIIVKINIVDDKDFWCISVSDNGSGIIEENREKIFEPNFTTKNSGMGLGLAMVKNIVNDFNGNIRFVTELGKGTTFFIQIPKFNLN